MQPHDRPLPPPTGPRVALDDIAGLDDVAGPDDVAGLGSILSVWAHPDDETYLAGGVMAAARDAGQRVVCATASAGELGGPDGPAGADRLGRIRRWESAAALAILGVAEHDILGLPDGGLAPDDDRGIAWAERLLRAVRPDTTLTFGPDGATFHPDHLAVHAWVTEAWRRCGRPGRLLHAAATADHLARFGPTWSSVGAYVTGERPVGVARGELALRLCLDGPHLDRKVTALRALATQTGDLVAHLGLPAYAALVAEESFVAAPRDDLVATAAVAAAGTGRHGGVTT